MNYGLLRAMCLFMTLFHHYPKETAYVIQMGKGGATGGSIMGIIKTPLGAVLILVITLILASLSIASAISGSLTAAVVSAAGLVVIVLILALVNLVGK